ncbi:MAG: chitobiase/beta-hexosaminidase C-terminal domain-containing protein [Anaeromyxobacteraceae bacterium]
MRHLRWMLALGILASSLNCTSVTPEPLLPVETPTLSPPGGNYESDQTVTIHCSTPGAAIHHTTDGTMPTAGSALYSSPIVVGGHGADVTMRALAIRAGMADSAVASERYTIIHPQVAQPTLTPAGGTYPGDRVITIETTTPGAAIHVTLDGSVPTGGSPLYTGPVPVTGMGTRTSIGAIATKAGMRDSPVATATYFIKILERFGFVPLEGSPHDVVHDPSRGKVYVSNRALNRIEVVDVRSHGVEAPILVAGSPRGMAISPDARSLLVTLHDAWKMSRIDLDARAQVALIDLPVPPSGYGFGPLRVDFDAAGTCIWRDATELHAFGNAYVLDLGVGTSSPLVPPGSEMLRYAPSFDGTRFLLMFNSGRASVWSSSLQAPSPPVAVPGFSGDWWDWMNQGAIGDSGEVVVLSLYGEARVYDRDFAYRGSLGGMAWGTLGPWKRLALVVPGNDEIPTSTVSLVDLDRIGIVDALDLPERIGFGEYNFGGQPIFLAADAMTLFVVGQTGLYLVDTSTVTE